MPIYEYECECGVKLEAYRSMENRYNVTCECGKVPELKISASMVRSATYFTTIGGDGKVIGKRQITERTPMVVSPSGREW